MSEIKTSYDTESVRLILGLPRAQDVRNLTRPGKPLHDALIRGGPRGRFDPQRVRMLQKKMIRRKLAATLGRTSPRMLSEDHSRHCQECQGIAVEWDGTILCENGHTSG